MACAQKNTCVKIDLGTIWKNFKEWVCKYFSIIAFVLYTLVLIFIFAIVVKMGFSESV
jgi:hypothetical protein